MLIAGPHALIADDLTGALDTGVHFLAGGFRPVVRIIDDDAQALPPGAGRTALAGAASAARLPVLDTESRLLSPQASYERVRRVTQELVAAGYAPFYKKIDSTFRGNVGAEIDAMLDALDVRVAAVVSSVPGAGRTVTDGVCLVRGVPLHESESGADHLTPHATSLVREIVGAQSNRTTAVVHWREIEKGVSTLAAHLTALAADGVQILLFDAHTHDDIAVILDAMRLLPEPVLLVGAAGLAQTLNGQGTALAGGWDGAEGGVNGDGGRGVVHGPGGGACADRIGPGPALFVAGSLMQTTANQVDRIAARSERVGTIVLDPRAALRDGEAETRRIVDAGGGIVRSGRHVVVRTVRDVEAREPSARGLSARGLSAGEPVDDRASRGIAEAVGEVLGASARGIVARSKVSTLVLCGGSTALAVIRALGVPELELVAEAEDGLPLCEARGGDGRRLRIVTKAGGFGTVDAYERVLQKIGPPAEGARPHE